MSESTEFEYPSRLLCKDRHKLDISEFTIEDRLYASFRMSDVDDQNVIKTEFIRMPDFSCNWARFSEGGDVRFRENGKATDGCLSFSVEDVRFENFATAVHDPICNANPENYAHCEVRSVVSGNVLHEPPRHQKKSKSKTSKRLRHAWRRNLRNRLRIEFMASE